MYTEDLNFLKKDDRIFVLKPMEGKEAVATKGTVDTRLFNGGNKLHAIKEPETNFWYMKYEMGSLPPELRGQKFTSFKKMKEVAEMYFNKRNIEIVKVED